MHRSYEFKKFEQNMLTMAQLKEDPTFKAAAIFFENRARKLRNKQALLGCWELSDVELQARVLVPVMNNEGQLPLDELWPGNAAALLGMGSDQLRALTV